MWFCPRTGYTHCCGKGKNDYRNHSPSPPIFTKVFGRGLRVDSIFIELKQSQIPSEVLEQVKSFKSCLRELTSSSTFISWKQQYTTSWNAPLLVLSGEILVVNAQYPYWSAEKGVRHSHWIWNMAPHTVTDATMARALREDLSCSFVKPIKQFRHIMCHKWGELWQDCFLTSTADYSNLVSLRQA